MTDAYVAIFMLCALHLHDLPGLSDRVHAAGPRLHLRLLCDGRAHHQPDRHQQCRRDVQRRAGRGAALPVHGLSGRAVQHPGPALPQHPEGGAPGAGLAGAGGPCHLRALRHRHRHRRCGGHADGPPRLPGHAEGGLRRPARRGRDLRGRHVRHPDPALDHADRLRCRRRRLGGQALCCRHAAGLPPGRPLHTLCHRPGHAESRPLRPSCHGRSSTDRYWP